MKLLVLLVLALVLSGSDATCIKKKRELAAMLSSIYLVMPQLLGSDESGEDEEEDEQERLPPRKRIRCHVQSIFDEQGSYYQRSAYRMTAEDFWVLSAMITPYMKCGKIHHSNPRKRNKHNTSVNSVIPCSIRLSCAIRYFAGGAADDTAFVHGVSNTEVYDSVWFVCDAVLACPAMEIEFPTSHEAQYKMAKRFQEKSNADYDCCAGVIDGMLVWTEKIMLSSLTCEAQDRKLLLLPVTLESV